MKNNCYLKYSHEIPVLEIFNEMDTNILFPGFLEKRGCFLPEPLLKEFFYYKEKLEAVTTRIEFEVNKGKNLLNILGLGGSVDNCPSCKEFWVSEKMPKDIAYYYYYSGTH